MKKSISIVCLIILCCFVGMIINTNNDLKSKDDTVESLQNEIILLNEEIAYYKNECDVLNKEVLRLKNEGLNSIELASLIYDVDPILIEAIESWETGWYTSLLLETNNNTYGGKYNGEYLSYSSKLESTVELARLLKYNYINQGLNTIELISSVYEPVNPTKWLEGVQRVYKTIQSRN